MKIFPKVNFILWALLLWGCLPLAHSQDEGLPGRSNPNSAQLQDFRSRMKDIGSRYNNLGRRLDSLIIKTQDFSDKPGPDPKEFNSFENLEPQTASRPTGEYHYPQNIQLSQPPTKKIANWGPLNALSLSYGICIPHNVKFYPFGPAFELEHDFGHQLQFSYSRYFKNLLLGVKLGTKFYQTHEIMLPGPFPARGDNFLAQLSLMVGHKYYLNDYLFFRNILSAGISHSVNQFYLLDGNPLLLEEKSFHWVAGLQTAIGIRLHEGLSASVYYQLDGIPSRKIWGSQFFSHFGASLDLHY